MKNARCFDNSVLCGHYSWDHCFKRRAFQRNGMASLMNSRHCAVKGSSIYGKGLYRYDSSFKAPIFRGTDAVLLFLGIPFFIFSLIQANRGSLRGKLNTLLAPLRFSFMPQFQWPLAQHTIRFFFYTFWNFPHPFLP